MFDPIANAQNVSMTNEASIFVAQFIAASYFALATLLKKLQNRFAKFSRAQISRCNKPFAAIINVNFLMVLRQAGSA